MNQGKCFQTQICADQGNAHQRVQTQVARSRSGAGRRASTSRRASSGKSSTRIEPPLIYVQMKPPQRAALSRTQSAGRRSARLWSRMQTGSSTVKVSGRRWYNASLPLLTAQSQRLHSITCVYAAARVACIGVADASICNRLQEVRMSTNITSRCCGFNTGIACG